jgi:hypothetical protein
VRISSVCTGADVCPPSTTEGISTVAARADVRRDLRGHRHAGAHTLDGNDVGLAAAKGRRVVSVLIGQDDRPVGGGWAGAVGVVADLGAVGVQVILIRCAGLVDVLGCRVRCRLRCGHEEPLGCRGADAVGDGEPGTDMSPPR